MLPSCLLLTIVVLASGFSILLGRIEVQVPNVLNGSGYSVVRMSLIFIFGGSRQLIITQYSEIRATSVHNLLF
jgi:hypothetical protein